MSPSDRITHELEDALSTRCDASSNLSRYFTSFDGRWFEHYSALSDDSHLHPADFACLAALSVPLDGRTLSQLSGFKDEFDSRLAQLPGPSVKLWEASERQIDAAASLYDAIRGLKGMGPTRASKPLAAKRPALIPIRDAEVSTLLGDPPAWWEHFKEALGENPGLVDRLGAAANFEGSPENLSVLRTVDVILWMRATES